MKQILSNGASVRLPIVITGTSAITASIYDSVGASNLPQLSAEAFNGKSEIRLDKVLSTLVYDSVEAPEDVLLMRFQAHNIKADINGSTYRFRRFLKDADVIMSNMRSFNKHPGYELTIPFSTYSQDFSVLVGNNTIVDERVIDEFQEAQGVFSAVIGNNQSGRLTVVVGNKTEVRSIIASNEPECPFYVRWLNEFGGWDYHMFAGKQKHTVSLTANECYQPYEEDEYKCYRKEGKEVVEVSSGQVSKDILDAIAYLPLSPDIRMYKKDTQEWVSIQVESGDSERYNDQPTGEVLLSFLIGVIRW